MRRSRGRGAGGCEPQWLPGEGDPALNDAVYAVTTWDADGDGPKPEVLVAGGDFTIAGGVACNCIARWDGSQWQALGTGMNGAVRALTVFNGELVAGGSFTTAGGVPCNRIARWDGSQWQPLGTGMSGSISDKPHVYALTVYNGELIAGGYLPTAGGQASAYWARWGIPDDCGACCLGGEICELETESDCLAAGGVWYGAGTACDPNPCGVVLCPGDMDCDGAVDFDDMDLLVEALTYPGGAGWPHACAWTNGDCTGDGAVDFDDIDPFVALIGSNCP